MPPTAQAYFQSGRLLTLNTDYAMQANVGGSPKWLVEDDDIELWVRAAMQYAVTEVLEEGDIAASVPGARGAWVDAPTEAEALEALPDVLFDWASMKLGDGDIPVFDGIDLNTR